MKKFLYFTQLSFILMWCSLSYALDISNVTDFFKTQNNPPTELFGIKLSYKYEIKCVFKFLRF